MLETILTVVLLGSGSVVICGLVFAALFEMWEKPNDKS